MTISEFITTRLAENEAAAQPLAERLTESGWTSEDDAWDQMGPSGVYEWGTCRAATRTLRDIEFMRSMLVLADEAYYAADHYVLERIHRELAAIWRDHPDYEAAWAPNPT